MGMVRRLQSDLFKGGVPACAASVLSEAAQAKTTALLQTLLLGIVRAPSECDRAEHPVEDAAHE